MQNNWDEKISTFIQLASKHKVQMIMVGGGAVNFHGYQRHSADVDFWISTKDENLKNLLLVFKEMGYEIDDFPKEVKEKRQNISVQFSPTDLDLELITNFSINKSFEQAFKDSVVACIEGTEVQKWNVLSYEDLITSKIKAGRPKDFLDIQQLNSIRNRSEHKGFRR